MYGQQIFQSACKLLWQLCCSLPYVLQTQWQLRMQVDVHTNLGDLWRAQGPSGQAEAQRCYAEALRVDVRHAPAWRGLGDLMRERGEHTPAVACYQVSFLGEDTAGDSDLLAEQDFLDL
jgi:hypothetical protein